MSDAISYPYDVEVIVETADSKDRKTVRVFAYSVVDAAMQASIRIGGSGGRVAKLLSVEPPAETRATFKSRVVEILARALQKGVSAANPSGQ